MLQLLSDLAKNSKNHLYESSTQNHRLVISMSSNFTNAIKKNYSAAWKKYIESDPGKNTVDLTTNHLCDIATRYYDANKPNIEKLITVIDIGAGNDNLNTKMRQLIGDHRYIGVDAHPYDFSAENENAIFLLCDIRKPIFIDFALNLVDPDIVFMNRIVNYIDDDCLISIFNQLSNKDNFITVAILSPVILETIDYDEHKTAICLQEFNNISVQNYYRSPKRLHRLLSECGFSNFKFEELIFSDTQNSPTHFSIICSHD
jgi:hypothetical protein